MIIILEGPDGSGKTTQSKLLAERMGAEWMCFPNRETPFGKLIDAHLKGEWKARWDAHPGETTIDEDLAQEQYLDAMVFQALQFTNRYECLPRLENAESIVLDRYWQSGYAYGAADGLDPDLLLRIHADLPLADLNILVDVPVELAIQRMGAKEKERYEQADTLQRVASHYLELWRSKERTSPGWVVVDGSGAKEQTAGAIWAYAEKFRRSKQLGLFGG